MQEKYSDFNDALANMFLSESNVALNLLDKVAIDTLCWQGLPWRSRWHQFLEYTINCDVKVGV